MSDVSDTALRQRNEAAALDESYFVQVEDAYALMYGRLEGDIEAFTLAMEAMENPTAAQVKELPQYKTLMRNAEKELDKFTIYLETVIGAAGLAALGLGIQHSTELVNLTVGGGFTGLSSDAMQNLLNYLDAAGPLYARLQELTGATVNAVIDGIISGVGQGFNPRRIAAMIQDAFGRGLTDALRNVRTVQLYAYRDAALGNYLATDGIVTGWVWFAELDSDVCLSCVAQHGTIHPLSESLNDHYNGRCAPLPYIPEFGNPVEQTGQAWFENLSPEMQKKMMGAARWDAWKAGAFEFEKLSKEHPNDVYGTMRTEASLKDLIGE